MDVNNFKCGGPKIVTIPGNVSQTIHHVGIASPSLTRKIQSILVDSTILCVNREIGNEDCENWKFLLGMTFATRVASKKEQLS